TRRVTADAVDDLGFRGDVTAHYAERLAEGPFDDVDPVRGLVACGEAAAARAVHADRVNLVDVGQRVVPVREVADRVDRRDVAVHRIDALEGDQLRNISALGGEQLFEVLDVVVAEDT